MKPSFRNLQFIPLLSAACLAACDPSVAGFRAPEGAVEEAPGVFVTRRDNPMLHGNADVFGARDDGSDATFIDRRLFAPNLAFITADRGPLFDRHLASRAYLWSEDSAAVATVGSPNFAVPSVRLPMDHSPVTLTLRSLRGRQAASDDPPMTTIGFDERIIDTQSVRLDDRVLVVPVRATVFAPTGTTRPAITPEMLRQLLDPGRATTLRLVRVDTGSRSVAELYSGRYNDDGSTRNGTQPPDNLWTTCDIQFRLISAEVVQDERLHDRLISATHPCGPLFDGPLTDYLQPSASLDAIPVFIGGEISVTLLTDYLAPPALRSPARTPSSPSTPARSRPRASSRTNWDTIWAWTIRPLPTS